MEFNPNKQYQMVSCGEESTCKIWEIRKGEVAVKCIEMNNLIYQSKFNNYHDQLILLGCDDGSVNLYRSVSTSSAPQLHNTN